MGGWAPTTPRRHAVVGLVDCPPSDPSIDAGEAAVSREALDLFISYAHEDEALRAELEQHLAALKREGEIRPWHDREIAAGDEWRGQIDDRLESADLILLLVSSAFLDSDYCFDVEAMRALERHAKGEARVIPVIVRPCDWQGSPFAELQGLPQDGKPVTTWANRDEAWLDVAQGLRAAIDGVRGQAATQKGEIGEREDRQPRYADDESRQLSRRLKTLFQQRKDLTVAGDDTRAIEGEILDVRRLLRKGPQLRPGEFLGDGRYELIEAAGQGGFATVWKAWDGEDQKLVALKVLHGHYSADRGKRERFFRGARKMAELAHPHVVRVLAEECADDGWHFFVMEYVAGGNFEQAVLRGALTPERRLEILLQAGEALEHAHKKGAIHRDVKPSNILLDETGARLSDFDLVRAADTTGLTATRAMMGTVQFAAPEALESAGAAGPAADVYSLASTAVFAFAGGRLPPWYYRDPARAITELDCAEALKGVLEGATAFERKERFASVEEFCRALDQARRSAAEVAAPGGGAEPGTESVEDSRASEITVPRTGEPEVWSDPILGMRFRPAPPGKFLMGSPREEPERWDDESQHPVTLSRGFWIAETAVTQGEWRELFGNNPSRFQDGGADLPVEQVSWFDAVAFANALSERAGLAPCYELIGSNDRDPGAGREFRDVRWLGPELTGYRLPTEAEWEYAARAGTKTPFWTGPNLTTDQANYDGNNPYAGHPKGEYRQKTLPVHQFQPNPWGLYQMHGNVWEWCADWYADYPAGAAVNPGGPEQGRSRVLRGGSWVDYGRSLRAAYRDRGAPDGRSHSFGLRLAGGFDPRGSSRRIKTGSVLA